MSGSVKQAARYLRRHRALYGDQLILGRPAAPSPSVPEVDEQAAALAAFDTEICQCQQCPLGATRTRFVFGVGSPSADLVFVGEAPGFEEDRQGEPFVGKAGKLLDRILAAIQLSRRDVYICNILKCRPPGNRDPHASEVEQCLPYLQDYTARAHRGAGPGGGENPAGGGGEPQEYAGAGVQLPGGGAAGDLSHGGPFAQPPAQGPGLGGLSGHPGPLPGAGRPAAGADAGPLERLKQ